MEVIAAAIIAGLFSALVAVINSRNSRKIGRQVEEVAVDAKAAREQVQNTHSTNLRDDLDKTHRAVLALKSEVREDIAEVREDVRGLHRDVSSLSKSDVDARREHADLWGAIRSLVPGQK